MAPMPGACEIALPFMDSAAADAIIVLTKLLVWSVTCMYIVLVFVFLRPRPLFFSSLVTVIRLISAMYVTVSLPAKRFEKTFFFGISVTLRIGSMDSSAKIVQQRPPDTQCD